ncbi:hypothetical protein, partial [Escherichia coli]|uniref:hypothetical protein n=1 Tax=Escherichia coli TaxID=562 RepID=UPI00358ED31E
MIPHVFEGLLNGLLLFFADLGEVFAILGEFLVIYPRELTLKWSTKTGHRVRVFSSIDFPIRLVVT